MKLWNVTSPFENAGKYRYWLGIIALLIFFSANKLQAQGGCSSLTPTFFNYEPCKYRVQIVNTSECTPSITVFIDPGAFESWSANVAGGWTGQQLAPNMVQLTHSGPFVPIGTSFPMIFTLPHDLVTNGNFTWEYTCGLGESCTLFPGFELVSCPDPNNASIIGVKYKECSNLPYSNQTPLSGWTIQAFDADGNLAGEGVTEADGSYGIYDLPKGQYIVREVQQPGWTPNVPPSGEYLVNLGVSEQRVINYGNCPPPPPPCDCPAGTQPGITNLVQNGNFSGSGGFSSGYTLNNSPSLQPGEYWIGSNPSLINPGFASCGDHTGGGDMMVVNGSTNANAAIWSQTYTMAPNSTYKFEYWVTSLSSTSPAQLISIFQVNNVLYGQNEFAPVTNCTWEKKCRVWTTNASPASITISIYNQNIATTGNDFAIDDISFRRCVNPLSDLTGVVHRNCDGAPYTDQPGLSGITVQLLDSLGNPVAETVTDTSGGYAFFDLPKGNYYCRVLGQPDDLPLLPAGGQALVDLSESDVVVQHFGICRLPQLPCGCPLNNSPGPNLVTNPDFSGNGGFSSSYTFNPSPQPLLFGEYTISDLPQSINADYQSCADHTSGNDNRMLIAAGNPGNVSFPVIWEQGPVTVAQNMDYVFDVRVAPLNGAYPDFIILEVNNTVIAVQKITLSPCSWRRICGTWNSGGNTTAALKIRGFGVMNGDVIALDDVTFRKCSTSVIGPVTGLAYRTCDAQPYTNQPVLSDWTVQLLDTMGNVIGEQLTDGSGEYAFYDLPLGLYWVRAVTPNGWTPSFPASGQVLIDLNAAGQSVVQNFGLCESNCYCGYYEMEIHLGQNQPVACGETIQLGLNQSFTLDTKFFCEGENCDSGELVSWNLQDPMGNNTGSSDFAMPDFTITALSPGSFSTPGTYTLTMYAICGLSDTCWCTLYFNVADPCCTDQQAFLAAAAAVQTFGTLGNCRLDFQAQGLSDCMKISYDWGDNTTSGPFGDNVFVSHTYTQPGTYTVCHTIEEISFFGNVCWNYQFCEQVDVLCNGCCGMDTSTLITTIQDEVTISVDSALCLAQVNMDELPSCLFLEYIQWGDGSESIGPFFAGDTPEHVYDSSGQFIVSYLVVSQDLSAGIPCFERVFSQPVEPVCASSCSCGTITGVHGTVPFGNHFGLTCGQTTTGVCPFFWESQMRLDWSFSCLGTCAAPAVFDWTFSGPNGILSGTTSDEFLYISPYHFAVSQAQYSFTLTPYCDGDACSSCTYSLAIDCPVDPCPCDVNQFNTLLAKGFKQTNIPNSCKVCFQSYLTDCSDIEWFVNNVSFGTYPGYSSFCYNFNTQGNYDIKMVATRRNSNGTICATGTYTKNIKTNCNFIDICNNVYVANPRFSQGANSGGLNSGGKSEGWTTPWGEPVVVEGYPGSSDGWTIQLSGNSDTSDVLSTIDPICLEKTEGTLIARFAIKEKGLDDKLVFQLYREGIFSLDSPAYWNPIRCLSLANLDISSLQEGWYEAVIPYDLSDWVAVDSCGNSDTSVLVRPAIFVRSLLNDNPGGAPSLAVVHLDEICMGERLVNSGEPSVKPILRIFPNPNTGAFTVTLPQPARPGIRLRIIDLAGRMLQELETAPGTEPQTVQTGALPDGLYFLQVLENDKVIAVEKFVKQ